MPWKSFRSIYIHWMPRITLLHPWPWVRFDARYSRKEPYEVFPHIRICAGVPGNQHFYRDPGSNKRVLCGSGFGGRGIFTG